MAGTVVTPVVGSNLPGLGEGGQSNQSYQSGQRWSISKMCCGSNGDIRVMITELLFKGLKTLTDEDTT